MKHIKNFIDHVNESNESQKTKEINKKMNDIFKKHKIDKGFGLEDFWEAVEDVEAIDKNDGKTLRNLAKEWEQENESLIITESIENPLMKLYNGIMNDQSIQRFTLGWKDVTKAIKKKFGTIQKSDEDFQNSLVTKALDSCDDESLANLITSFGKELDMNLDTFGKGNPQKR